MTTTVTTREDGLDARSAAAVRDLAAEATTADGVAALSEASRLALGPGSPAGTRHLLAECAERIVGYAQVWPDDSVELVVAPDRRREGVGGALWRAATAAGGARVWAHGDLPAARRLAASSGLVAVRSLLKMGRSLTPADRTPRPLPAGYAATTYADRERHVDDPVDELQELNAAAFADHPEQGGLTVTDLRARMAEPWFDPRGLILVLDESAAPGRSGEPVAFHWTKVESGQDPDPRVGEVYVVGVHPTHQGRGLAGPLTDLGLAHLATRGCTDVILYVDGENIPARATYERAGLRVLTTDRVYASAAARVTPSAEQGRIGS
jgi:mycothiol synthase